MEMVWLWMSRAVLVLEHRKWECVRNDKLNCDWMKVAKKRRGKHED